MPFVVQIEVIDKRAKQKHKKKKRVFFVVVVTCCYASRAEYQRLD